MQGPKWYTMQYSGQNQTQLTISTNITSDIYVLRSASGDPNNFVHDMSFKGVKGKMTLDADNLALTSESGYSVAIYVSAIDEPANKLLEGTLEIEFSEGPPKVSLPYLTLAAL